MASADTPSGPDPTLYLYTSLTAGSSHIITATSRMETILKANKIAFRAIDCATDEKARQLWSRRSKGKKIPGLVKFGQIVGDLTEVEEWNEYGELKEQVESVDNLFGDTPMTDNPMPPPAPITLKDPLNKIVEPVPRSGSESRHISISDPRGKEESSSAGSSVKNLKDETPMAMAMRQAGAEAAAKAGQRKTSTASSLKSSSTASVIPTKRDSSEITPSVAATKMSADAEEPADATDSTAAKVPEQLAAEGAKRTSVDKIDEQSANPSLNLPSAESEPKSNEEQMLDIRRNSSVTKVPSRLAQETSIDEVGTDAPEPAVASETNLPATDTSSEVPQTRQHRGSSLGEASIEQIKEIEAKTAIREESEEDEDESSEEEKEAVKKPITKSDVQANDEAEAEVLKGSNPQDQKTKDADAAGVSALFLRPDANLNRLSADSASVYSFFDSSFSPAPLFSSPNSNLNLDFDFKFNNEASDSENRPADDVHSTIDEVDNESDYDDDDEEEPVPIPNPLRTPARKQTLESVADVSPVSSRNVKPVLNTNLRPFADPETTHFSPISPIQANQTISRSAPPSQLATPSTPNQTRSSPPATLTSPSRSGSFTGSTTTITTTPTSATPSRSLRFKKSLKSLRSKTSIQQLFKQQQGQGQGAQSSPTSSPLSERSLNLPPQKQLKAMGEQLSLGHHDTAPGQNKGHDQMMVRKKSSMRNLLCF